MMWDDFRNQFSKELEVTQSQVAELSAIDGIGYSSVHVGRSLPLR